MSTPKERRRARAVKLSRLGAVRRAKALRRAVRLQERYANRLEGAIARVETAIKRRAELIAEVKALTEAVQDARVAETPKPKRKRTKKTVEDAEAA